jgi:hypothetical protein
MLRIRRTIVDSSDVHSYGYDEASQTIQVRFRNGGNVYEYYRRGPSVWRDFQVALSKGSFVYSKLTPGGNYKKVA